MATLPETNSTQHSCSKNHKLTLLRHIWFFTHRHLQQVLASPMSKFQSPKTDKCILDSEKMNMLLKSNNKINKKYDLNIICMQKLELAIFKTIYRQNTSSGAHPLLRPWNLNHCGVFLCN